MGFGSAGSSKSSSTSSQGLDRKQRGYFSGLTPQYFSRVDQAAQAGQQDPMGLRYQSAVDQALPVGRYGLPTGATEGAMQLGRDLFSQNSGARTLRGFNSPNSIDAVVGDAVRMASPTLIPLSTQFAMDRAKLLPELNQASFGYASAPLDSIKDLLAGSSNAKSNSFSWNASAGVGNQRTA
jgi:hypothetical protein